MFLFVSLTDDSTFLNNFRLSEPVVQFNTWVSSDSSCALLPARRSPKLAGEHVHLEDVQTDEVKLNSSLLSESTFLPFAADFDPHALQSDSEDETETFETDSLAPAHPSEPEMHGRNKTNNPTHEEEREVVSAAGTAAGSGLKVGTPQTEPKLSCDFGEAGVKEAPAQEQEGLAVRGAGSTGAEKAAVKIQSCWRGHHARRFHPAAREARGEIRLRRMQEHILFLSDKLDT